MPFSILYESKGIKKGKILFDESEYPEFYYFLTKG
ncbi:hypothetical protein BACCIP111895_01692 [Neobacillus rhizosphaerae]|uniref:Crp/Fnr family transcriptional regulator n=1 Tax=Neobacillus rhizosphaerae TaxID=2880965 RepID=A0ABM9EPG8_9BACI|nr:hypothetical protein BACCIP111895_01692 [Neobacillus rhizosphaerae]